MKTRLTRLTRMAIGTALLLLSLPLVALAGPLDDYYLHAFGREPGSALEKAVLSTAGAPARAVRSATPLHRSLRKDLATLEPASQKVLAKELAAPVLSGSAQ